jgi:hypothetical protein
MIKPMKRKGVAPDRSACFYAVILEVWPQTYEAFS